MSSRAGEALYMSSGPPNNRLPLVQTRAARWQPPGRQGEVVLRHDGPTRTTPTIPARDHARDVNSRQLARERADVLTDIPRSNTAGRDDRGAASVELTLATPLLGLLLLVIVQFALWAHATHVAQAAANEGVQTARAYGSTAAAGRADANAILDQMAGSILVDRSVTAERTAATATVTVQGKASSVLPGLSVPIHVSVTAPREKIPGVP